jgi:tryptophanyl-tRNA synthetase
MTRVLRARLILCNDLGANRQLGHLPPDHNCLVSLIDLHALAVFQKAATTGANLREIAASLIA